MAQHPLHRQLTAYPGITALSEKRVYLGGGWGQPELLGEYPGKRGGEGKGGEGVMQQCSE